MDLATSASHIDLQGMAREAAAGTNKQANKIKIALSLYKVQQNIYLLDFQRVEVREHTDCVSIHSSIHLSFHLSLSSGAMLGTGLGIGTAALIGDSYVHTFAAFSTFTALSLGMSEGKRRKFTCKWGC